MDTQFQKVRQVLEIVKIGYSFELIGSLVIPMATMSHLKKEYHGEDAEQFVADRWVVTGKQAVTLSKSYFPFGLGRWACPGRWVVIAGMIRTSSSFICTNIWLYNRLPKVTVIDHFSCLNNKSPTTISEAL